MRASRFSLIALLLTAAPVAAFAETTPEDASATPLEWVLEAPELISVDGSDPGSDPDFYAAIQKLVITTDTNTQIILTCQTIRENGEIRDARMNIGFDLDVAKAPANSVRNIRRKVAKITIGDKQESYPHRWNVATDIITPMDRRLARKVYNGGVRGDVFKLETGGKTKIDIVLPPVNDAFRTFATGCPVTNAKAD